MKGTLALGVSGVAVAVAVSLASALAACTFLVDFEDRPPAPADGGEPEPSPTATATSTSTVPPRPDSGVAPDASGPFSCAGKDNVAVPFRADTACCGGVETSLTSKLNCGGCGIECQLTQTCTQAPNFRYYCTGCGNTGGRPSCWSDCCSGVYGQIGICAPSDCDDGLCVDANCTIRGMKCVQGSQTTGSYCEY